MLWQPSTAAKHPCISRPTDTLTPASMWQDARRPSDDALSPMSARLSGMRSSSCGGRRAVMLRRSLSDAHQLPHFRRDAAAWIEEMLGVAVPAGSDDEFRAALADGVYLCQILNALKPRTVHHVR